MSRLQKKTDVQSQEPVHPGGQTSIGVGPMEIHTHDSTNSIIDKIEDLSLKQILDAEDSKPESMRYDMNYIHASSLLDCCPRQVILMRRIAKSSGNKHNFLESYNGGYKVMWKIGRAVETHIRNTFTNGVKYKNVYGIWKCRCGHTETRGFYKEVVCPKCDTAANEYNEFTIFDEEAKIVGNPDYIIKHKDKLVVIEIKSMNKTQFDSLTEPVAKHIQQALLYRLMLSKQEQNVSDTVHIIYCTKDFKFGSPYKEFKVSVESQPFHQTMVESLYSLAKSISTHNDLNTVPPREKCPSIDCSAAKNCVTVTECFNL